MLNEDYDFDGETDPLAPPSPLRPLYDAVVTPSPAKSSANADAPIPTDPTEPAELSHVIPSFVHVAANWPVPHDVVRHEDAWLSDYVDECPVLPLDSDQAPSPADPPEDHVMKHGSLVTDIHRYFRGLEWKGRSKPEDTRPTRMLRLGFSSPVADRHAGSSRGRASGGAGAGGSSGGACGGGGGGVPCTGVELQLLQSVVRCAMNPALSKVCPNGSKCFDIRRFARAVVKQSGCSQEFDDLAERVQEQNRSRSFNEMVVLELLRQLRVLQVNAHKFYSAQSFASLEVYGKWRKIEMDRVNELCETLWNGPLPMSHFDDYSEVADPRALFARLVELCIACDEAGGHALRNSSTLSQEAAHLIHEYGLQYGVSEVFRNICMLEFLAGKSVIATCFFQRCLGVAQRLLELLPGKPLLLTTDEMNQLRAAVTRLHGKLKTAVMRMQTIFPNNTPPGALPALIDLIAVLLEVDARIGSGQAQEICTIDVILTRYLNESFVESYQRMFQAAAEEDQAEQRVTAKQLIATIHAVTATVQTLKRHFRHSFRRYVDLVSVAARSFYDQLCTDFRSYCLASPTTPAAFGEEVLDVGSLQLAACLCDLDKRWQKVLPAAYPERWKAHFSQIIVAWLDELQQQLTSWVATSVASDQWKPVSVTMRPVDAPTRGLGSGGTCVPVSASFVDVFFGIAKTITFARELMSLVDGAPAPSWDSDAHSAGFSSDDAVFLTLQGGSDDVHERRLMCSQRLKAVVEATLRDFVCKLVTLDLGQLPANVAIEAEAGFQRSLLASYGLLDETDLSQVSDPDQFGLLPYPWGLPLRGQAFRSSRRVSRRDSLAGSLVDLQSPNALTPEPSPLSASWQASPFDLESPLSKSLGHGNQFSLNISRYVDSGIESGVSGRAMSRAASDSGHRRGYATPRGTQSAVGAMSLRATPVGSRACSHAGSHSSLTNISDASTGRQRRSTAASTASLVTTDMTKVVLGAISKDTCLRVGNLHTCRQMLPELAAALTRHPEEIPITVEARHRLVDNVLPGARVYLNHCWQTQLDTLVFQLNTFLKPTMLLLLRDLALPGSLPMEQRLRPVVRYLKNELQQLKHDVVDAVLTDIISALWATVLQDLQDTLLAPNVKQQGSRAQPNAVTFNSPISRAKLFSEASEFLRDLLIEEFCTQGNLRQKLQRSSRPFLRLCSLTTATSLSLVQLFHGLACDIITRKAEEELGRDGSHAGGVEDTSPADSAPTSPMPARPRSRIWGEQFCSYPSLQPPPEPTAVDLAFMLSRCRRQGLRAPESTVDMDLFAKYLTSGLLLTSEALRERLNEAGMVKHRGVLLWKDESTFVGREVVRWVVEAARNKQAPSQLRFGGGRSILAVIHRFVGQDTGLVLQENKVLDVLQQSAAALAGMSPNDLIVSINGQTTEGLSHDGVSNLLKPTGSELRLSVQKHDDAPLAEAQLAEEALRMLLRAELMHAVVSKGQTDNVDTKLNSEGLFRFEYDVLAKSAPAKGPRLMYREFLGDLWRCDASESRELQEQVVGLLRCRQDPLARLFVKVYPFDS